ncbi:MAG TPA: iron-sulfur cluster repair di-iron protein [Bryobacteraceae bacterium]|nr:iron-sulfur cluster repair di-iron protein [Bryobacteraceae bacterium]
MQTATAQTIRDIAANSLAAVRVFEKFGIDYCCGGKRQLADVCREKGYDTEAIQTELDAAMSASAELERDWSSARLSDLIEHIVGMHHEYLRRELPAIEQRLEKVYRVYNQRYGPTLTGLPEVVGALKAELETHLLKEERVLFPAIAAFETAVSSGRPLPPTPFGTVANPIHTMENEHETAGQALSRIREITGDFAVPEYACVTYSALMSGLDELERDLHMHIHLENNILFPRAEKLEASQR